MLTVLHFLYLFLYFSVPLSVSLYTNLSFPHSVCLSFYLSHSTSIWQCLSLYLHHHLQHLPCLSFPPFSVYSFICLSLHSLFTRSTTSPSVFFNPSISSLPICLSFYHICLSIPPFVFSFICLHVSSVSLPHLSLGFILSPSTVLWLSPSVAFILSFCLSVCHSFYPSVCFPNHLSLYLPHYLFLTPLQFLYYKRTINRHLQYISVFLFLIVLASVLFYLSFLVFLLSLFITLSVSLLFLWGKK